MNHLKDESSPYLKQHKDNPVDWYPWGEEAFEKAKKENKPVFLSIGYSTCHWCHVMAHESFEDDDIAGKMNDAFINIKVDREELPHIDSMYMTVCQLINGHGGWPLTIVMTPEKEPFFAATYIPKDARQNRIGMRQLIPGIKGMWNNEPDRINKAITKIREGFERSQLFEESSAPDRSAIENAVRNLKNSFDPEYGGFGSAPKFPSPHNLRFLLREYLRDEDPELEKIITETLRSMRLGGLWDHIGYGFHRYSTDREWLLPHFEKMLYDQALLMITYAEAYSLFGEALFEQTVHEIADYLKRNMLDGSGLFYAAEDADSEGEEGKFYVFESTEVRELLDEDDTDKFISLFGFSDEGNFEDESTGLKTGKNIPRLKYQLPKEEQEWFERVRPELFSYREKRVSPGLDNKILTDWNALLISALAEAGAALDSAELIEMAETAYKALIENHYRLDEGLFHILNDAKRIPALADDYAFTVRAALDLYRTTAEAKYLKHAINLNNEYTDSFYDHKDGGFYLSKEADDQVLGLQKQIFDGAVPSSNSVTMFNLAELGRLTGNINYDEILEQCIKRFSVEMKRYGSSITMGMMALQRTIDPQAEVVITTAENQDEIMSEINKHFIPDCVIHLLNDQNKKDIEAIAPYTKDYETSGSDILIYVCRNFSCERPVKGLKALKKQLSYKFGLYS
ncbi:thioredoxin domain-containing protein [Balneola sp. MJW-20]|uniref:thioredoxin domain-containing protein n=1 Tax=Gracilimonas aurantiaca TaxID=3234185 RepID=UPI003467E80C